MWGIPSDTFSLRAWIDQPLRCLYFESPAGHDTDGEARGTAGGLHIDEKEKEIEPVTWTEKWDNRIRHTSTQASHPVNFGSRTL